ncbi:protein Gawky isoform X2 [Teleopsis dalmanni]|uniref:protein Gawky isoform X2 n=1 Tax=Teleopsis dalmanni TaxID=139649 RepID=UPI0018CDACEE|nr:protein Gawky isoform X2 [Teleopsis dalmanni]
MLAANLPVCQYAGMPPQNNNNSGVNNSSNSANNNCNSGGGIITNNNGINSNSGVGLIGGGTSAAAAKNQLEQLNTMREALFSQDGWGCQHVNQDTNWEVPSSPEPVNKDPSGGTPLWKPTINNGTDLWESNLRNGGQPPSQPIQKTPWGHTPSSNLGGTWGEDDDGVDSSNVWTGSNNNASTNSGNVANVGATGLGGNSASSSSQWGQSSVSVGVVNSNTAAVGAQTGTLGVSSVSFVGNSGSTNVAVSGTASNINHGNSPGNGWGDPRDLRSGPIMGTMDMRNVDPRDPLRAASAGDPRDIRMIDPRDPIRGDPRGISGRLNGNSEMWGQHHPVTHNPMTSINKMVGQAVNTGSNIGPTVVSNNTVSNLGPGVGSMNVVAGVTGNVNTQWGVAQTVVGAKDMNSIPTKSVTGWEEPSPPPQRRNLTNYDDGTSLWSQQARVPGGTAHWKDISDPINRSHLIRGTITQNTQNSVVLGLSGNGGTGLGNNQSGGMAAAVVNSTNHIGNVGPQTRLAAVGPPQHKTDNTMWGVHPNSTGRSTNSWGDDGNHSMNTNTGSNWVDEKTQQINTNVGNVNAWNDSAPSWNKNQNKMPTGTTGWGSGPSESNDLNNDWSNHNPIVGKTHQKLGNVNMAVTNLSVDMIKQSKQFRLLVDAGYKKDDVERVLLAGNVSAEEAAEVLRTNASIGLDSSGWRRHDESLSTYGEHATNTGGNVSGFHGRYPAPATQPSMSFPPNNLLNNMGAAAVPNVANNPNLSSINSMQPMQMKSFLNQGQHTLTSGGPQSVNATSVGFAQASNVPTGVNAVTNTNNGPSAQQLRMLVQQIQLAVHSGYLSNQILNQPLAPATLILLNQLLSNIKHLQGAQQTLSRNTNNIQINTAITKYKQQIQNLQNQINTQQAIYIKQQQSLQQPSQHPIAHVNNTEYLRGQHEAINALQGSFSDMTLSKTGSYQGTPSQQSRLNQWKLPVLEKDVTNDTTDFSRAPGATKQSLVNTANVNNIGPLGIQSDGTWSAGRNIGDGWPDSANDNENKDWSVAQTSATAYTDLVQEFEPGKPWKIKNIEDDPSITPGSVARSPLSINPTPKDADIFANASKNSPTDLPPLSLSSSTWSFNPTPNSQNFSSWSENAPQCATSELWATPINKTSRGPPPGLGSNKNNASGGMSIVANQNTTANNANGWLVGSSTTRGVSNVNSNWAGTNTNWNTNWLLIKNLTSQIDGSTLRTLCMQHGPLISFHLYLNQGIALCKYATREEVNKAQMTLNNCTLGNTTICVETPSENEVQNILQHIPQSCSNAGTSTNNSGGGNGVGGSNNISTTNASSGNVVSASGNTNVSVANSTVLNGSSNTSIAGNTQVTGAPNCNINSGNNSNGNGGVTNAIITTNANTSSVQNSTWRPNQQNQTRPTGRETDFDYISKYVCSIVDD